VNVSRRLRSISVHGFKQKLIAVLDRLGCAYVDITSLAMRQTKKRCEAAAIVRPNQEDETGADK
jgi:hypothetical protein